MFTRRQTPHTLGEHGILGDEAAAELSNTIQEFRTDLAHLKARVDSQFTTIAAHAEIARDQAEFARQEARSDLERSRETLIGLIEQVRAEHPPAHVPGDPPGPSTMAMNDRIGDLEARITDLGEIVERCFARQNELAGTMTAFLDTMMAEQRDEPVAGLSLH